MKKNSMFLVSFLLVLLLIPSVHDSESNNWSEEFNGSLTDWELYGSVKSGTSLTKAIPHGFSINDDGVLTSSFNSWYANASFAWHNSTINYGTWRFDVFIPDLDFVSEDLIIDFICSRANNDYNLTGSTISTIINELQGFYIWITTLNGNSISLGSNDTELKSYTPNSSLYNGFHNFHITRDTTGEFNLYIDKSLVFSVTDNKTVSSKKLGIESWYGVNKIDNITVLDQVLTPDEYESLTSPTTTTESGFSAINIFSNSTIILAVC